MGKYGKLSILEEKRREGTVRDRYPRWGGKWVDMVNSEKRREGTVRNIGSQDGKVNG